VQHARRAVAAGTHAREPWELVERLRFALGLAPQREISPRLLFAEMAAETPAFSGMTWGRLAAGAALPVHGEVPDVD
jgi:predicted molibdopterin-dependent oxidoreductase YjgC